MRLIDKDALLKGLGVTSERCEQCKWGDGYGYCTRNRDFTDACDAIYTAPTIEERKTGKWIEFPNHNAYKCSECGRVIETTDGKRFVYKHFPFCHCGAKMEGEQP